MTKWYVVIEFEQREFRYAEDREWMYPEILPPIRRGFMTTAYDVLPTESEVNQWRESLSVELETSRSTMTGFHPIFYIWRNGTIIFMQQLTDDVRQAQADR